MSHHDNGTNLPLKGVSVFEIEGNSEFYFVGIDGITAVEWHEQPGHMAMLPTIRVYRDGKLHSEHPFHNVLGVYYADAPNGGETP